MSRRGVSSPSVITWRDEPSWEPDRSLARATHIHHPASKPALRCWAGTGEVADGTPWACGVWRACPRQRQLVTLDPRAWLDHGEANADGVPRPRLAAIDKGGPLPPPPNQARCFVQRARQTNTSLRIGVPVTSATKVAHHASPA